MGKGIYNYAFPLFSSLNRFLELSGGIMQLLFAVNSILPKLGERPVTSLEGKHPTLAIILPVMEMQRRSLLQRGWWFNEFKYTAYPNLDGEIFLGSDFLSFIPKVPLSAAVRGERLYNPATLSYKFDEPIEGKIIQDVEFEFLPDTAARAVLYFSLSEVYVTDLDMTNEVQEWKGLAAEAWNGLLTEHLRQMRYSTQGMRTWNRITSQMRS